jgi:prevent-host-death family protein
MTRQMTATQFKARVLSVLDEVADGEEVEITKHGRTVARVVPATGGAALRGDMEGLATTVVDEELLFSTGETWNCQ